MQYFPTLKELNKKKIIVQLFLSCKIIKYYATPHFIRGYLCSIPSGFFLHQIKATPVGFGRPFLIQDNFAAEFLKGTLAKVVDPEIKMPIKTYFDAAIAGFYDYQIAEIAAGRKIDLNYKGWQAVLRFTKNELKEGIKNRWGS